MELKKEDGVLDLNFVFIYYATTLPHGAISKRNSDESKCAIIGYDFIYYIYIAYNIGKYRGNRGNPLKLN